MIQPIKWEWKKLLLKNNGLLVIVLYFTICIISIILMTIDTASPVMQRSLERYYQEYGGELDDDTVMAIEAKYQAITEAVAARKTALSDYEAQNITYAELNSILRQLQPLIKEKRPFEEFYSYYKYASIDTAHRHLIDGDSWSKVLSLDTPNFVLIMFMILMAALLLKDDVKKEIILLNKPTYRGHSTHLFVKWLVTIGIVAILVFCTLIVEIVYLIINTSLQNGRAPLQSISYFADSPYNLTIWQAYLVGWIIRIGGLLYVGMITVCSIELLENTALGVFCALAATVIPYFAGGSDYSYLQYPTPAAFIQAFFYLLGRDLSGTYVDLNTVLELACISALIVMSLCALSTIHYQRVKVARKLNVIHILLVAVLMLQGCANTENYMTISYTLDFSQDVIEAIDYYVYKVDGEYFVYEKETHNRYALLNDPLEDEDHKTSISYLKAVDNVVYFVYYTAENKKSVQSIDLDTGERKILFVDDYYGRALKIFDVVIWEGPQHTYESSFDQLVNFFPCSTGIILLRGESITYLNNSREVVLYEGIYGDVTSNGESLFFINDEDVFCRIDVKTMDTIQYADIYPYQPTVVDNKVYYIDHALDNSLCVLDAQTGECTVIASGDWASFKVNQAGIALMDYQGNFYYSSLDDFSLEMINTVRTPQDYVLQNDCTAIILMYYESITHVTYEVLYTGE